MSAPVTRRALVLGPAALTAAVVAAGPAARGQPVAPAASSPAGLARLIANENPYGPAASARRAVEDSLATAWQYPMGQQQVLKQLIGAREGLTPEHVMIGEGSVIRFSGLRALDGSGIDQYGGCRETPLQDVQDVAYGRAAGRGDDADPAWHGGQGPLALGREQALPLESFLQLVELAA